MGKVTKVNIQMSDMKGSQDARSDSEDESTESRPLRKKPQKSLKHPQKKKHLKKKKKKILESESDDFASSENESTDDDLYDINSDLRPNNSDSRACFWISVLVIVFGFFAVVLFLSALLATAPFPTPPPTVAVRDRPTPSIDPSLPPPDPSISPPTGGPSRKNDNNPPTGGPSRNNNNDNAAAASTISNLPGLSNIQNTIKLIEAEIKKLCDRFPLSDLQRQNKCIPSLLFKEFGLDNGAELKAKLLQSILRTRTFKFVIAGASSSAGADVRPAQVSTSWLRQELQQVLGNVLGLNITVANIAGQGTTSYPVSVCLETYLPTGADIITYDWATFGEQSVHQELFVRAALMHHSQPVVFFTRNFQGPNNIANYWTDVYYGAPADLKSIFFGNLPPAVSKPCSDATTIDAYVQGCLTEKFFEGVNYTKTNREEIKKVLNQMLKFRKFDEKLGDIKSDSPLVINPISQVNHSDSCRDDICRMAYYYKGMYVTSESDVGHYFDFLQFYMERRSLLRAAHHPGSLSHLLQTDSYMYFIYKVLLHALRDIEAASSDSKKLQALGQPPRRPLPVSNWNGHFPHARGGWCSLAARPIFGPDMSLQNMTHVPKANSDPAPKWSYRVVESGRNVDPNVDQKNYWQADPPPVGQPFRLRFQITQLPASILMIGPAFAGNDNLWKFGSFAIDDGPFQKFTRNLSHVGDDFFERLMWGPQPVGHQTWAVGEVPRDFKLGVGEHFLSIQRSTDESHGEHRMAGIIVL